MIWALIYTDQTNRNPCLMRISDVRAADGMLFFSHASGWLPKGMLTTPLSAPVDQQYMDETGLRSLVIDRGQGAAFENVIKC